MKDSGDPSYRLGVLYATGDTVKLDYKHAKSLFLAAAKVGNIKAQCALGELYEDGRIGAVDCWRASLWYAKAAEKKHPIASYRLGMLLEHGGGGIGMRAAPEDKHMALEYYLIAAEAGLPDAMFNCGALSASLEGDHQSALKWYTKAVELGHPGAMNNLACMYERGQSVLKDRVKAVELYKQAADLGDDFAQTNLALLHAKSAKRKERAASWFNRLVEEPQRQNVFKDFLTIQYTTSLSDNSSGWLQRQQKDSALKKMKLDASKKLAEAQFNVASIYARANKQQSKSAEWFLKASQGGNVLAMFNYAMMLWEGIGVEKDLELAEHWMQKSADGGNLDAKYNVGVLRSILSDRSNDTTSQVAHITKFDEEANKTGDVKYKDIPVPKPHLYSSNLRPGSRHNSERPQVSSISFESTLKNYDPYGSTGFSIVDAARPGTNHRAAREFQQQEANNDINGVPKGTYFCYWDNGSVTSPKSGLNSSQLLPSNNEFPIARSHQLSPYVNLNHQPNDLFHRGKLIIPSQIKNTQATRGMRTVGGGTLKPPPSPLPQPRFSPIKKSRRRGSGYGRR